MFPSSIRSAFTRPSRVPSINFNRPRPTSHKPSFHPAAPQNIILDYPNFLAKLNGTPTAKLPARILSGLEMRSLMSRGLSRPIVKTLLVKSLSFDDIMADYSSTSPSRAEKGLAKDPLDEILAM